MSKKKIENKNLKKFPKIKSHFASNIKMRKYLEKLAEKSNNIFKKILLNASQEDSISAYLYKNRLNRALKDIEEYIDKSVDRFLGGLQNDVKKYMSKKLKEDGFGSISKNEEIENVNRANIYQAIDLIKSIPRDILESYMTLLYNNINSLDQKAVYEFSREVGKVNHNRAKTISRDQVAKSIVNYTIAQSQSIGLDYYIWVTADDSRVSEDHRHLNNRIYCYSKPTAIIDKKGNVGHPAQRVNCRCVPVSVFLEPNQEVVLRKDAKWGDYYEIVEKD